jgi:hypothetical protein
MDQTGSVVNGDCYWLTLRPELSNDLLWLALGVANSTFAEAFYDHRFHNKLYSGRRRFITQYVQHFPLPNPDRKLSKDIVELTKRLYKNPESTSDEIELNKLVWLSFGLSKEV